MSTIGDNGIGGFGGFGSIGGGRSADGVDSGGNIGPSNDVGGVEAPASDGLSLAGDGLCLKDAGKASELELTFAGTETVGTPPWAKTSDPLGGIFSAESAAPPAPAQAPGKAPGVNSEPVEITTAGRALADKFGSSDKAWAMSKQLRDNPTEALKQQFREAVGQDLTPLQLRDVEHYLYAAKDVSVQSGVGSRAVAAAKMTVLTTGYSALKVVAQHTGNSELEKNAAGHWKQVADQVPTDGSALNAAKYVGAKVLEAVVSPIDIRDALGMGSNVKSSRATWSEFTSGLSGTLDGLFRGK